MLSRKYFGNKEAASFTTAGEPHKQTNKWLSGHTEREASEERPGSEGGEQTGTENKATAKKKLQPKEMILLSNEKLSYRWPG